jgi:hypothetical protein
METFNTFLNLVSRTEGRDKVFIKIFLGAQIISVFMLACIVT